MIHLEVMGRAEDYFFLLFFLSKFVFVLIVRRGSESWVKETTRFYTCCNLRFYNTIKIIIIIYKDWFTHYFNETPLSMGKISISNKTKQKLAACFTILTKVTLK